MGAPTVLHDPVSRAHELAANGRRLLGITGPPGAGKSTLSSQLVTALGDQRAVVVGMDGFHLAQRELDRRGLSAVKGAPETFDRGGYVALLSRLTSQTEDVVLAPEFRRDLEEPIGSAVAVTRAVPLVITEGNYLLTWPEVGDYLDECWWVEVADEVRIARLVARHIAFGRTPEAAREWVMRSDEANAAFIEATRDRADFRLRLPS